MASPSPELTIAQAALYFQVKAKTVRTWVARYHLKPSINNVGKPKTYRFVDLVAAERRARNSTGGRPPKDR